MLLLQDLNTDVKDAVKLHSSESTVQLTLEMFTNEGQLKLTQDYNDDLSAVLEAACILKDARSIPAAEMNNPAEFAFLSHVDGEVTYVGHITDGGNVIVIQTIDDGESFYQTVAYKGSRGRWLEEINNMLHNTDMFINDLISDKPVVYETNGPSDMLCTEDAYRYTVRQYEMGNREQMTYWLNKATMSIKSDTTMSNTANYLVKYLAENDTSFSAKWDAFVAHEQLSQNMAREIVFCN